MHNQHQSDQIASTALLLLGAGNSSRLGKPKQLLELKSSILLNHILEEISQVSCQGKVLVLGAYYDEIQAKLNSSDTKILYNENWESGMASSIKAGMNYLIDQYDPQQVMILLCDQPFVNHELMDRLISLKNRSSKGIIASAYAGTIGVPVIFDKTYFSDLLALNGKEGAKRLVQLFGDDVETVFFPKGYIDIDTELDYEAFLKEDWSHFDRKKN